ncbi:MAG: DNA polymerase IV [Armatimonadota bacterium]
MDPRIILHVDMDAFYAAVEQRDRPELRGKPVIVGGTPQGRGVVATASYEARAFGIRSAMPAAQAVRLCPDGIFLQPDFHRYRQASEKVMAILRRYSDTIEQISIDEAFLDLTGRAQTFEYAERIARRIKDDIRRQVGLTASVGAAPNKFLAKLASDHRKPDGLVVVRAEEAEAFLAPLPIGRLWGVGPKTAPRLEAAGLRTIGDITSTPIDELRHHLGAWADVARELARGLDDRPVEIYREAKSVSAEETFPRDLHDLAAMRRALARLSDDVAERLKDESARARTIAIKVRFSDFRTITRQRRLPEATDRPDTIRRTVYSLLDTALSSARDTPRSPISTLPSPISNLRPSGIRLLGVRATQLERGQGQLSLFDETAQRRAKLERTLSYLRQRYGDKAVTWARRALKS